MSGYGSLRKRTNEPAQPERDESRCVALGCPCRASVSVEGSGWTCSAHAHIPADRWPAVTEKLREHDWLISFMGEVTKLDRNPPKDAAVGWRAFATQFWQGTDDQCVPHPNENAAPYLLRMRGELLWRAGALHKRPAVRLPAAPTGRGNAARFLSGGAQA